MGCTSELRHAASRHRAASSCMNSFQGLLCSCASLVLDVILFTSKERLRQGWYLCCTIRTDSLPVAAAQDYQDFSWWLRHASGAYQSGEQQNMIGQAVGRLRCGVPSLAPDFGLSFVFSNFCAFVVAKHYPTRSILRNTPPPGDKVVLDCLQTVWIWNGYGFFTAPEKGPDRRWAVHGKLQEIPSQ